MKLAIVFAALVASLASAQTDIEKIALRPSCADPRQCPLQLHERLDVRVVFSLTEPIVCDASLLNTVNGTRECAVAVKLINSHPDLVVVSPCFVKWTTRDYFQQRSVRIAAVEQFRTDLSLRTVTITTEPAISPSVYYSGFNPRDIIIQSVLRSAAQCRATGDPHYTTYDGAYWHFYDGNTYPNTRITMTKNVNLNTGRPFGDIQVEAQVRGNPAINCAVAAREGNNLVIVDVCSGRLILTNRFGDNDVNARPKVEVTGATYTIYFRSGFWVRADTAAWYMNVYLSAPGMDYGNVCGICGNFNGNPNDDYQYYTQARYDTGPFTLTECQRTVNGGLWNWQPSGAAPTEAPIAAGAAFCNYTETFFIKPILNNADGEDVTDGINQGTNSQTNRTQFLFDEPEPKPVVDKGINLTVARAYCVETLSNDDTIRVCNATFGIKIYNMTDLFDECAVDIKDTQDYSNVEDAITGARVLCAEYAQEVGMTNNTALMDVLCLNGCNGRGACRGAKCICNNGFDNPDCSYDASKGPQIALNGLVFSTCEMTGHGPCPAELAVTGRNFYKSSTFACRLGTDVLPTTFLGGDSALCTIPDDWFRNLHDRFVSTDPQIRITELTLPIFISNNYDPNNAAAATWSNSVNFTFFNGLCLECQEAADTNNFSPKCNLRSDSCTIDGICHLKNDLNPQNECQVCNASMSKTSWSYGAVNEHLCSPIFAQKTYERRIICNISKGETVAVAQASNRLVPNMVVTYSLVHNFDHPTEEGGEAKWFEINPTTGVITTKEDIDIDELFMGMKHAADNPLMFNGFFAVKATTANGLFDLANVVIDMEECVSQCVDSFNKTSTRTVPESLAVGAQVFQMRPINASCTGFTYSFWWADGGDDVLQIDATTGAVTLKAPLDYESFTDDPTRTYETLIRVRNAEGVWRVFDFDLVVTDVAEPPSAVTLSSVTFSEGSSPLVGRVGVQDAENDGATYTYAIVNTADGASFELFTNTSGTFLRGKATATFDYESAKKTYSVSITVTKTRNGQQLTKTTTFSLSLLDVNEAPFNVRLTELATNEVAVTGFPENTAIDEPIAFIRYSDAEGQKASCQCTNCPGFQIDNNMVYILPNIHDHEVAQTASLTIVCVEIDSNTTALLSTPTTFVLNVVDANEAPESLQFAQSNVPVENVAPPSGGTVCGKISFLDYDKFPVTPQPTTNAGIQSAWLMRADVADPNLMDFFTINLASRQCVLNGGGKTGLSCTMDLVQTGPLDYEAQVPRQTAGSIPVRIKMIDYLGLESLGSIIVSVTDANDAPSNFSFLPSNPPTVEEGVPLNHIISTISVVDADSEAGPANNNNNNVVLSNVVPAGAMVLQPSARRAAGSTYVLVVKQPKDFDYEAYAPKTKDQISFTLTAQDANNAALFFTSTYTLSITDKPVVLQMSSLTFAESVTAGTEVAKVTLQNYDLTGAVDFFLVQTGNFGDEENAWFTLELLPGRPVPTASLKLKVPIDFESMTATSQVALPGPRVVIGACWGNPCVEATQVITAFQMTVTNVNEPPTLSIVQGGNSVPVSGSVLNVAVPFGANPDEVVLTIAASDPEKTATSVSVQNLPASCMSFADNKFTVVGECSDDNSGTITLQDASGLTATFSIRITQNGPCTINPCKNNGKCKADNKATLGFKCDCATGYSGTICDLTVYKITTTFDLSPPPGASTKLSNADKKAIADEFKTKLGLDSDTKVTVELSPDGTKLIITYESTELPGDIPALDFNIRDVKTTAVKLNMEHTQATSSQSENNSSAGIASGAVAGIVVGVILLLILVVLVLLLLRKHNSHIEFDKDPENAIYSSHAINPTFQPPNKVAAGGAGAYSDVPAVAFETGVSNPMYEWYQPELSRQECTNYLMSQGEGAFVIRDSQATPGWHMLGVKTNNEVIHEKIRFTEDGQYELLPTKAGKKQPKFPDLPSLVDFYLHPTADVPYTLAVSNPIYDNHQLGQGKGGNGSRAVAAGKTITLDPHAPVVPLKEKEVQRVQELADGGDDIYTNQREAKAALQTRKEYQQTPAQQGARDVGYLDLDPEA